MLTPHLFDAFDEEQSDGMLDGHLREWRDRFPRKEEAKSKWLFAACAFFIGLALGYAWCGASFGVWR